MSANGQALAERYLKFGIFLAPFHPMEESPLLCMERDMQLLQHIDMLGYDEAWVGEHHSGGFEIIANPEMFIAQAIERTRHIRLGTGVISLPYHNPYTVASRMTQLDYQARGRAMFGVGPGALVGDAFRMGIDPENQRRMLNEALEAIVPLMRGEQVTMETDWFNLRVIRGPIWRWLLLLPAPPSVHWRQASTGLACSPSAARLMMR
jgi:limonene 1,2-monooxygenase